MWDSVRLMDIAKDVASLVVDDVKDNNVGLASFDDNEGADINAWKALLGHSSLAATQVYTHNSIEQLKQAYKQAHPRSEEADKG